MCYQHIVTAPICAMWYPQIMNKAVGLFVGGRRDIAWGILNALVVSSVVYAVNFGEYGAVAATLKQAVYALLFGSHVVRAARYVASWALAHYLIPNTWAVWIGISSAFVLNIVANIILHTLKGTPHPAETILAIAGLSLVGLTIAGHVEVRRLRSRTYESD